MATINTGSHTVLNFYSKPEHGNDFELSKNEHSGDDDLQTKANRYCFSLLTMPRSLLILSHRAYTHYLHEIEDKVKDVIRFNQDCDRSTNIHSPSNPLIVNWNQSGLQAESFPDQVAELSRQDRYSFTFRHVPKVLKTKLLFHNLFNKQ